MGVAILNACRRLGIGFTQFVSMGNKADVSGNDLLEYWEDDDRTKVIGFYLESIGNVEKFKTIVRRVTSKKPILMVKSGRTATGARAATSHTGALAAGEVAVVGPPRPDRHPALRHARGALRPRGRADAGAAARGPPRRDRFQRRGTRDHGRRRRRGGRARDPAARRGRRRPTLRSFLPTEASTQNPVDMIASASSPSYVRTLEAVLAGSVDRRRDRHERSAGAVRSHRADGADHRGHAPVARRPVLSVFMAPEEFYDTVHRIDGHPPLYRFPESAVRALGSMCRYAEWKRRPIEPVTELADVDDAAVAEAHRHARKAGSTPEAVREGPRGLSAPVVPQRAAASGCARPSRPRARSGSRASSRRPDAGSSTRATSAASSSDIRDEAAVLGGRARDARAHRSRRPRRRSRGLRRPAAASARPGGARRRVPRSTRRPHHRLRARRQVRRGAPGRRLPPASAVPVGGARADRARSAGEDPPGAPGRAAGRSRGARGHRPADRPARDPPSATSRSSTSIR